MIRFIKWGLIKWGLVLTLVFGFALPATAAEITISCGSHGQETDVCAQAAQDWASQSGNTVKVLTPPAQTNQIYFKYLLELGDAKADIDVYQLDVIWPGLLAKHFADLREYFSDEEINRHFPAIIANNTVDGRLVGMPWYTDVGLLYYRKELLEKHGFQAPQDWSELADIALYIQTEEREAGNAGLWGFVFQGAPYEGLTCDALEWIDAYGGGTIIDAEGAITVNNPRAVLA